MNNPKRARASKRLTGPCLVSSTRKTDAAGDREGPAQTLTGGASAGAAEFRKPVEWLAGTRGSGDDLSRPKRRLRCLKWSCRLRVKPSGAGVQDPEAQPST